MSPASSPGPPPVLPLQLPFTAVVGQDDAKLALLLTAVDPRIGGVLLRGEKGTAKSTLARGLAAFLPGSAPFVELPIGATEDRVVGTLDLTAAFTGGELRFSPGLLAAADGGVLYVDEINLLPDHLVDVLLDVAASGINRVEREGVSHAHASRFLLVGSMNPEEGDLRPQLLDRFGLAVDVRSGTDPAERAAAVRRRLAFDEDPAPVVAAAAAEEAALARRLSEARSARLPEAMVEAVSSLCVAVGAEGLRADLTICRAAAALAGWEGRVEAGPDDVRRVAPLALAHRSRRHPLEPAGMDRPGFDDALSEYLTPPNQPDPPDQPPAPNQPDARRGPVGRRPARTGRPTRTGRPRPAGPGGRNHDHRLARPRSAEPARLAGRPSWPAGADHPGVGSRWRRRRGSARPVGRGPRPPRTDRVGGIGRGRGHGPLRRRPDRRLGRHRARGDAPRSWPKTCGRPCGSNPRPA